MPGVAKNRTQQNRQTSLTSQSSPNLAIKEESENICKVARPIQTSSAVDFDVGDDNAVDSDDDEAWVSAGSTKRLRKGRRVEQADGDHDMSRQYGLDHNEFLNDPSKDGDDSSAEVENDLQTIQRAEFVNEIKIEVGEVPNWLKREGGWIILFVLDVILFSFCRFLFQMTRDCWKHALGTIFLTKPEDSYTLLSQSI